MKKHDLQIVLIIDDDPAVRSAFSLALEGTSCTVTLAGGGEEGVSAIDREEVDLIFLDLNMPGINGVDTLRQLREKQPDIPIYIVTAFADDYMGALKQASHDGLDFELLRKPLDRNQILSVTLSNFGAI